MVRVGGIERIEREEGKRGIINRDMEPNFVNRHGRRRRRRGDGRSNGGRSGRRHVVRGGENTMTERSFCSMILYS
jgi:hypothetical protein